MTATVTKIPDPLVVLRRAEQKHTGEEPGELDHLADAVRIQIIAPLTAGGTPVVDDVQVKQLLADKQRLETVVEEQRKILQSSGKEYDRIARENAAKDREINEARAARDTAVAQLRDQGTSPHGALQLAQEDNVRLADELAAVQEQLSTARRDLAAANKTLDEIADEQESAPAAAHGHQYPVSGPGEEAQPCACGQPYPRSYAAAEFEEIVPDVEPWGDLFGRIRDQVSEAGWTS